MRQVIVYWIDASVIGHNLSLEEITQIPIYNVITHGFLAFEDDKIIRVTQNRYEAGDQIEYQGVTSIPRGCRKRIEEVVKRNVIYP